MPSRLLERHGEVHIGRLPAEVNAANTACEWAGRRAFPEVAVRQWISLS